MNTKISKFNYQTNKRLAKELNKKKLIFYYIDCQESTRQIAKRFNCSHYAILNWLRKFDISIRKSSESIKGKLRNTKFFKILTKDYLKEEYINKARKVADLAKEHNTSHSIICYHLKKFNISTRKAYGVVIGENHWNWKNGGKSLYTSYFKRIRKKIVERDNYKCQICDLSQENHKEAFNKGLEVHHIDFDKSNDNFNNLITLCKVCHLKLNLDIDYWYAYCKYIVKNKILNNIKEN